MLRALFFDVDDTLFSTTDFAWHARERAVDAMLALGLRADRAAVLAELRGVVEEFTSNDDRHFDRLLGRLPAAATAGLNRALIVSGGVIAYHEAKARRWRLRPRVQTLLEDLAALEVHMGIVSAGITSKQMEKILRLGLHRYVDRSLILVTDQEGIAKANPKLYKRAVRRAGVRPEEALHVGDHPVHDVGSAKAAGLQTVWVRGEGKYSAMTPDPPADHVIDHVWELRGVLADSYGLLEP
ncbi:MAG TPA: HAD-IA family hydrolase [Planctomycetota bacterium]